MDETLKIILEKDINKDDLKLIPNNTTKYLINEYTMNGIDYIELKAYPVVYKGRTQLKDITAISLNELPKEIQNHYENILELTYYMQNLYKCERLI